MKSTDFNMGPLSFPSFCTTFVTFLSFNYVVLLFTLQADARQHTLAKYFMELTLVDYEMARRLPSEIAAAALLLSGKILKNSKWTKSLEYYSSFTELELQPIIKSLTDFVIRAESSKLKVIYIYVSYPLDFFIKFYILLYTVQS